MKDERKLIGELLIEHGYISRNQLEEALEAQQSKNEKLCNILIDLGHLGEAGFLEFLSSMPGTASIELSSCELSPDILKTVPAELAHRLELVPIGTIGAVLTVAMVCPLDTVGRQELEHATGLKVRPVLCSRASVIPILEKYYGDHDTEATEPQEPYEPAETQGLEESLKLSGVARLIEEIEDLPTLPDIVQRVSQIADNPDSSAADLAEAISTDGSISAKLLRLANSPAFGFSRQISQVKDAVTLLGFTETKTLVTSVAILGFLADDVDLDFRAYWNHSFTCATLSRLIAKRLKTGGVETAFVAGLLHDVGKMAVAMTLPGKQAKIAELCAAGDMTEIQAEEAALGLNHAEVGYQLGEHWLLPPDLTAAIRGHHTPEPEAKPTSIARVLYLADILCKLPPSRLESELDFDANIRDVLELLQLSEQDLNEALNDFAKIASDIPAL
jgi:putative nucleotidyltransferase with HDIG domain